MNFNFEAVRKQVQGDYTEQQDGDNVTFRKTCSVTGRPYEVTITAAEYHQWRHRGRMIQDVLHRLSPDQREFLISRQTPAEFDALFGDE